MTLEILFKTLLDSFVENNFIKATLGNQRTKNDALKNVMIKPVQIKNEIKYSFIFRYATNDITKNFSAVDAVEQIKILLNENFFNADIFTKKFNYQLLQSVKEGVKIKQKKVAIPNVEISLEHNHHKERLIGKHQTKYFQSLGVMSTNGEIKKEMQHKFKQINRYVEIVSNVLNDISLKTDLHIVDMGSGKGYLTFALADYMLQQNPKTKITGIEIRKDLVDLCNKIAIENEMFQLSFIRGNIHETTVNEMNVLIALHACDTATDDAINIGIKANAAAIICAPCCHKQVRKAMKTDAVLHSITKHGILFERQAEIITDSLRALWLESNGYKTKIFDFVDVNDTPKNVMIVATKTNRTNAELENFKQQYIALKKMFGVEFCHVAPDL